MDKEGFEDELRRVLSNSEALFGVHEGSAAVHIEPFARQFYDNPDKAIDDLVTVYNKALDDAYTDEHGQNNRAFIQAIAGGPCEVVPWALYNALGAVYPYLERPQKDRALGKILNILDQRNYAEVNGDRGAGHTTGIREPLLLSDIAIVRPLYWPGLRDQENLVKGCKTYSEFYEKHIDKDGMFIHDKDHTENPEHPISDFLVGYALLRTDFCSFGEEYLLDANPDFRERLLKGIVALRFGRPEWNVEKGEKRLREVLPKSFHDRITPLRLEGGWADVTQFR